MNRREFLKSLAAIGTSLAINPARATESEIDTAWQSLSQEPRFFYVGSWGTISSSFGVEYPTTRRVLFWLDDIPDGDDDLLHYIESESIVEAKVDNLFDHAAYDDDTITADSWQDWLERDPDALAVVRDELEKWLEEVPDECDWERADLGGFSGRGDALRFFDSQQDIADLFNIAIIWGDHPGSSYYAAELRMEIEEANAIAEANNIPIRFEHDEE